MPRLNVDYLQNHEVHAFELVQSNNEQGCQKEDSNYAKSIQHCMPHHYIKRNTLDYVNGFVVNQKMAKLLAVLHTDIYNSPACD